MSLEGQRLGDFQILERLGQGGMGAVYKARQVSLDRFVALKTLQAAIAADPEYIARFSREAKAAAALNHPNLVQVYAAGENDGLHWFAMEFVEGESAQDRLRRKGRLEPEEAIAIATHVATALEYGWRKAQLIHRDIKPDNIFLSTDGEVKLGDLGLAKSAGETQSLTMTGSSMGTPHYVSPEQGQGKKDVDLRADIYSLGCTLFHLVSGEPPFKGDTALGVMMQHVTAPVPNLRSVWPQCPEELARVVMKMMLKQPAARQQNYAEVIADLRRAYDALSGATMPARVAVTQQPSGHRQAQQQSPAAQKPAGAKKGLPVAALVGGGLALLAAIAALFYFAPWKKGDGLTEAERAEKARTAPGEPESGFVPVFDANGIRDWRQNGAGGKWDYAGGVLTGRINTKSTTRLRCPKDFAPADFEIRFAARGDRGPSFEFRQDAGNDLDHCYRLDPSGLKFGSSVLWGGNAGLARAGQRIGITRDGQPEESSKLTPLPKWKDGDWNEVTLTVQGNRLSTTLNGVLVAEVTDESPSYHAGPGEFGFRVTNTTDGEILAEFKNLRIKSLAPGATSGTAPVAPEPGFTPLFGADGLQGWDKHGADWTYKDGVLTGRRDTKGFVRLTSKDLSFADYEIRFAFRSAAKPYLEFRIDPNANPGQPSGSYFTLDPENVKWTGTVLWFTTHPGSEVRTKLADSMNQQKAWKDGDWNDVRLVAEGRHFVFSLNGTQIIDTTLDSSAGGNLSGGLGFSMNRASDGAAPGEFRDIRIRRIAAPGTAQPGVATPATATKDAPFVNSLGMKFVPVPGTQVLFSIWDARVRDYTEYAKAAVKAGVTVDDSWTKAVIWGVPVSREPEHPVGAVSWEDATAFCKWLTAKERAEGKLPQGMSYRLPSDDEWSRAVGMAKEDGATPMERNGKNQMDFPWGTDYPPKGKVGNYGDETYHAKFPVEKERATWVEGYTDGFATTSPVGNFAPNQFGLYDMGGNVWQWCEDLSGIGGDRTLRGASWGSAGRDVLLSSRRDHSAPRNRRNDYGFRCIIAPASSTPGTAK